MCAVARVDDPRDQTLGRARTFLPLVGSSDPTELTQTSIVVLSSRPSLLRAGVLADDHLAAEVAAQGRLTRLLRAADSAEVSFAVDPALVAEAETMAGGYQVQSADGSLAPGTGQEDAADWLEVLADVVDRRDGYRLLYGSPDVAALVHDGQSAVLTAAATAGQRVERTRSLPLLVMPPGGAADAATMAAIAKLNPAAVVLSQETAPGPGPLLEGPGGVPIVTFPTGSSDGGPGPDPRNTPVQVQQRALAGSWVEATTISDDATHGRVRLLTTAAQAVGGGPSVQAPWVKPRPLEELLKGRRQAWSQRFSYPAATRTTELTLAQLGGVKSLARRSATYADLLADGDRARAEADAAVARAASAAWRKRLKPQQAFLAPQLARLNQVVDQGIRISSNARVRTVALEGVYFPITIVNTLEASDQSGEANAVRVKLVFTSDNSQRLTIETIDAPLVLAQDSVTANAKVTARANGTVPVTAQLTTESGIRIGRPFEISVQVTQNGTTGWVIALAAGIVLAGSTALRIRQVARERARSGAAETTATSATRRAELSPTDRPSRGRGTLGGDDGCLSAPAVRPRSLRRAPSR